LAASEPPAEVQSESEEANATEEESKDLLSGHFAGVRRRSPERSAAGPASARRRQCLENDAAHARHSPSTQNIALWFGD